MERPRIVDETDHASEVNRIYGKDGPLLLVVVKATFVVGAPRARGQAASVELASKAARSPIRFADVPWGDAATTPIRYPCDWFPSKPGTDVVFVGNAEIAEPTARFEAMLKVGSLSSRLAATGPRVFGERGDAVSAPRPTACVPIRWDLAWGGLSTSLDGAMREEPRNPLGLGIAIEETTLTHTPAPQLEELGKPIARVGAHTPAGLGAIGRHFEPRRSRAGTYDVKWHRERAPLPPVDADPLEASVAAPGLFSARPLEGGEPVELVNLIRGGGAIGFALPRVDLRIEIRAKGHEARHFAPQVDTVLIDASHAEALVRVELVYRASVPAPPRMGDAEVFIDEEL
jgi:hypothetical protein